MARKEVKMTVRDDFIPHCADCKIKNKICEEEEGQGPTYCPTIHMVDIVTASRAEYEKPEIHELAVNASIQEGECYTNKEKENPHVRYAIKPRMQETIEFAHKMGYKKLGLAFCGGLRHEARIVNDILKSQGFKVASVVCKAGKTPKEFLKISEEQKVNPGNFESMCSPITQALALNAANTDFNILFGLCVGHDSLVMHYSNAFCTALVVKDRVTGHNPLAAIQLHDSYYRKLKQEEFHKGGTVKVTIEENQ